MLIYFSDIDKEIHFSIYEERVNITKKVICFLSQSFGKEFEEVSGDWADDYNFDKDTLIIKVNFFNEDLLELVEMGVDIVIIK